MTLLIRGGEVFLGNLQKKNILIDNGKIVDLVDDEPQTDDVIDADGLIILPGAIDAHVHFREPGNTAKEDFLTGSQAAAAGGVTTVLDMPNNNPPITTIKALEEKRKLAAKSVVNFGLFMGATEDNADEIKEAKNIPGVKIYMGSSTGNLLVTDDEALKRIFSTGKLCVVHAEDEDLMKENMKVHTKNHVSSHGKIRNRESAQKALLRAIELSGSAKIHIAHISTKEELDAIRRAKQVNVAISCEVTPHHLFLSEKDTEQLLNYGKMNPPLRSAEDVSLLWEGLRDGTIDIVATDHAPHLREEKDKDYSDAPSGIPGVDTMLPLLLDSVQQGRISLERVVEVTSSAPARIFGLKKGKIEKGYDADLVLVDMNKEQIVRPRSKCGWSAFEGQTLKGWPQITLVNGQVVFDDGETGETPAKEVNFI